MVNLNSQKCPKFKNLPDLMNVHLMISSGLFAHVYFFSNSIPFLKGNTVAINPNQVYFEGRLAALSETGYYARFFKRLLDIVIVLTLAVPTFCILMAVIPFVAFSGVGSAFYKQQRIGKDGRVFWMWKLRSMVPDAKKKLEEYLVKTPEARVEWDLTQKLKYDPRITRIGRFIRKTSLDELPQFWNVFMGEMSFVGPRPIMIEQREIYPGKEYFSMLPGITGFWQISDRNECSFAERAHFDAHYFQEMSFMTDLRVLLKTICVVIKPTGC